MGPSCMVWTRGTREQFGDHEKYVELPPEMRKWCPEYGRLRVSLYGTCDVQPQIGRMRAPKYCRHTSSNVVSMFIVLTSERDQDSCPWR